MKSNEQWQETGTPVHDKHVRDGYAPRQYRAYGEAGSYVSSGTDVQAQAIFAGQRPVDDLAGWGYEREEYWGTLRAGR